MAVFSWAARVVSVGHALRGIVILVREQHNVWIHLASSIAVVGVAVWLSLSPHEWALLFLAMGLVWMGEALNTAVEYLADALHPELHPMIKKAKDTAAAGVLLAALFAIAVAGCVFGPHLIVL